LEEYIRNCNGKCHQRGELGDWVLRKEEDFFPCHLNAVPFTLTKELYLNELNNQYQKGLVPGVWSRSTEFRV
jgi:hypothetical protein